MEYKSTQAHIEVKKADGDVLKIRAYALAFGNLDSTGDIIMPSACDKWLAGEMASRVALCYQHEFDKVIGKITDKGVDDKGLWIEAEVLPTSLGKDVQILLSHGAVKEFSIGYTADEYHFGKTEDADYEIRYLDAITIFEVSPVTIAANPKATLVSTSKSHPEAQGNDPENENSHTKDTDMPENTFQEKAEKMQAELKTAVEQANEAKAAAANLSAEISKANESIDNLDKSVKELKSENESLRKQLESKLLSRNRVKGKIMNREKKAARVERPEVLRLRTLEDPRRQQEEYRQLRFQREQAVRHSFFQVHYRQHHRHIAGHPAGPDSPLGQDSGSRFLQPLPQGGEGRQHHRVA